LNPFPENTFRGHLALLKVHFCFEKTIGLDFDQVKILALHDEGRLDLGAFLSKLLRKATMQLLGIANTM
jgi:hypothetical protein